MGNKKTEKEWANRERMGIKAEREWWCCCEYVISSLSLLSFSFSPFLVFFLKPSQISFSSLFLFFHFLSPIECSQCSNPVLLVSIFFYLVIFYHLLDFSKEILLGLWNKKVKTEPIKKSKPAAFKKGVGCPAHKAKKNVFYI